MSFYQNFSPINQLILLVAFLGVLFGFLVVYLDNSNEYELKRDWRKNNKKR